MLQFAETLSTTGKIFTSTNKSNVAAQKLFLNAGYAQSGRIENLDEEDPELIYFKKVGSRQSDAQPFAQPDMPRQGPKLNAELSPAARRLWSAYESSTQPSSPASLYECFHFGDSELLADELASLVLSGVKRATACLLWSYEAQGKHPPKPGDVSIVELWSGQPVCLIETTSTEIVPFGNVDAEFAEAEGEGDGSLEFWRCAHWEYFRRECLRLGRECSGNMPVVCERFRVVQRAAR